MNNSSLNKTILITGAAGFIGSTLVDTFLNIGINVIGIDSLTRGTLNNLKSSINKKEFMFFEEDIADFDAYITCIKQALKSTNKIDEVWHMAANSDIAAGTANMDIDFKNTFLTTHNTLKIMRLFDIKSIAFASSSAIYGVHNAPITEDIGPLLPISNYGAMKLASEGEITSAAESFLNTAYIFRFPNVIGSRATHGVIYDFMHKLKNNPNQLEVLGDGLQQKPYLHVSELIEAMLFITSHTKDKVNYFNIGTLDSGITVKEIAQKVISHISPNATIHFTGGSKGWVGDIPRFEYSLDKLTKLGWQSKLSSSEAVERAIEEIRKEILP